MNTNNQIEKKSDFFNTKGNGTGYLGSARIDSLTGKVKVVVHALSGPSESVSYTSYNAVVVSNVAKEQVKKHLNAINDGQVKVLCNYKIANERIYRYAPKRLNSDESTVANETYRDDPEGLKKFTEAILKLKLRSVLCANLVGIDWLKIDGELVYTATSRNAEPTRERLKNMLPLDDVIPNMHRYADREVAKAISEFRKSLALNQA